MRTPAKPFAWAPIVGNGDSGDGDEAKWTDATGAFRPDIPAMPCGCAFDIPTVADPSDPACGRPTLRLARVWCDDESGVAAIEAHLKAKRKAASPTAYERALIDADYLDRDGVGVDAQDARRLIESAGLTPDEERSLAMECCVRGCDPLGMDAWLRQRGLAAAEAVEGIDSGVFRAAETFVARRFRVENPREELAEALRRARRREA